MPDLDFFAAAYEGGALAGRAVRWLVLLAAGFTLVRRLVRGSWGPGFRNSPLGTVVGLVAVAAGLLFSVTRDFDGGHATAAAAGRDMTAARAEVVRGCVDQGQAQSVCECYGDEVLRRTGRSPEQFAALERDMIARQKAGQPAPPMLVKAAQYCAGRG
jgi:hypothetical protein